MIFDINAVGSSCWEAEDLTVRRQILLKTEIGLRTQAISLSFETTPSGTLGSVFLILFNYSIGADENGEKPYFGFRLTVNDLPVASGSGLSRKGAEGDSFCVFEPEQFDAIVKAFAANLNLTFELIGEHGVATSFPIPADANFAIEFVKVRKSLEELGLVKNR